MDMDSVKLFVDVWKSGNLTKTASQYYLTQSTVSKRLAILEKELGIRLFLRQKGKSQVLLTPEGEAFYDIAVRMLTLNEQAFQLQQGGTKYFLTAAAVSSVQDYTLPPFILKFQAEHPELLLTLENHHSVEIFPLVENERVDVGLTHAPAPYPDLNSLLLYEEDYLVMMRAGEHCPPAGTRLHPWDLDPEHEIFQSFCGEWKDFHDHWWSARWSKLRVNNTSTAQRYFSDPGDWMVVPACIAQAMHSKGFVSYAFSVETPRHKVYLIWKKRTENPLLKQFISGAVEFFTVRPQGT